MPHRATLFTGLRRLTAAVSVRQVVRNGRSRRVAAVHRVTAAVVSAAAAARHRRTVQAAVIAAAGHHLAAAAVLRLAAVHDRAAVHSVGQDQALAADVKRY